MLQDLIKTAYARGGESSERITSLGRRAAQRFIDSDDRNLTAAVSSVVGEEGDLSRAQIERVSEAANQQAWKSLFVEGGSESGVDFEPADASDVLSEVAPSAPEVSEINTDYHREPALPASGMDQLLSAFDAEPGPDIARLNPAADAEAVHEKVSHARNFAQSAMDNAYLGLNQQAEEVYVLIKTAMAEETPFELVCRAVAHACEDPAFAADVLKVASARMSQDGTKVCMDKVAHAVAINDEHPLVIQTALLEKQAQAYVRSSQAHEVLVGQSKKTMGYIRDKLRGV